MNFRRLPLALPALLAGCTVGPNYSGPPAAAPNATKAPGFVRAGDAPVVAQPPVARWWETLADPTLNAIEARAIAANPDLAAAEARLRQARASLREQKADLLPKADATALYAHARFPGSTSAARIPATAVAVVRLTSISTMLGSMRAGK